MEKLLKKIYYNLNSSASFAGVDKVLHVAKQHNPNVKLEDVKKFLEKERTYTLFKPVRRKYQTLKTNASGLFTDWQCDLAVFDKLKNKNKNYKYLLVCIDVLSRKMFVAPAKTKSSVDMIEAFDKVFAKSVYIPWKIMSDQGLEFTSSTMKKYFESKQINKISMVSQVFHAGMAERAIRTIKERLYKYFSEYNTTNWVDVIDKIVQNINNSINKTTGVTPNSINFENTPKILEKLYKKKENGVKKHKYSVNDIVRISRLKNIFEKGYYTNFTDELFKITKVFDKRYPFTYRIVDLENNPIKGIFYEADFAKTSEQTTYRIEKILKTKKDKNGKIKYYIKWLGHPESQNSWINKKDIIS